MDVYTRLFYCKGCGCEISICVYWVQGNIYCCEDCYRNIPCHCGELLELDDGHKSKLPSLPVSGQY